jgi:Ca2+-binding EF-hand superfamily protein
LNVLLLSIEKEKTMLEAIDFQELGRFFQIQQMQQLTQLDPDNTPIPTPDSQAVAVDISSIGKLLSSSQEMDPETAADLKDFMKQMREAFQAGNFDAQSIAGQASDKLAAFAKSHGIDLVEAVTQAADFVQTHMPPSAMPAPNADRLADDLMKAWDANGDQVLTPDEVPFTSTLFEKLDDNKDGRLDKNELKDLVSALNDAAQTGQNSAKKAGGSDGATTQKITAEFDTNGDGVADTQEITTYNEKGEVESVTTQPA